MADPPPETSRPLKRPPNYNSRRVQSRLLVLVSMFMLVLLAMDKARRPETWHWLWSGEDWAQSPDTESDRRFREAGEVLAALDAPKVNTKLPPPTPEGTPQPLDSISTTPRPLGEVPAEGSADQRVKDDLWAHLLQALDAPQGRILDRVLYLQRNQRPLEPECLDAWPDLLERLAARGRRYFKDARRATEHSTLDNDQLEAWLAVVDQQQEHWEQTLRAMGSLAGIAAPHPSAAPLPPLEMAPPKVDVQAMLADVQMSLDRLALANIKDNTVHRPIEGRAWFRMMERLQTADLENATDATQRVGFLQLFRQPDIYRGKLVTLHGTIELAYRLKAPPNAFDIDEYSVLWVRPTTGPSSPVVVYALELPPGFPAIASRDAPGKADASTTLSEEVDVTGYYFKNWAYRSREGINTAPLMLARSPRWQPSDDAASSKAEAFTPSQVMLAIAGMAVLAIVLTLLAYQSTRLKREQGAPSDKLTELQQLDLPSTKEQLRRMSGEERQ